MKEDFLLCKLLRKRLHLQWR